MKVSEYHKQGLKNKVEEILNDYQLLGDAKEGVHHVKFFIKKENGKIVDIKFNSSKRCKKLMAIADLICEKIKGDKTIEVNDEEILEFFKEEKEKDKMKNRLNIIKKTLGV